MWTQLIQRVSPRLANRLNRVSRRTWRLLLRIVLVVLIAPLLLQILLAYIVGNDARLLPPALHQAKNLLIVTAHPDDECLFFAPSILGVLDKNKNPNIVGGLLVLSTGKVTLLTNQSSFLLTDHRKQLWNWRDEEIGTERFLCVLRHRSWEMCSFGYTGNPRQPESMVG
jgi:hypothetical protein